MICPNCRSNYKEKLEFCANCGVRLVAKKITVENTRCPYCGVEIKASKCINCGAQFDNAESNKVPEKLKPVSMPKELKNLKWDNTFVKTNMAIIIGIMGIITILMLIMNNL